MNERTYQPTSTPDNSTSWWIKEKRPVVADSCEILGVEAGPLWYLSGARVLWWYGGLRAAATGDMAYRQDYASDHTGCQGRIQKFSL